MTTESKAEPVEVLGALIAQLYLFGMPAAFIAVQVWAALEVSGWLRLGLCLIVVWNLWVLTDRLISQARVLVAGNRAVTSSVSSVGVE